MEEWPTIITETDFNGTFRTWDLETHITDADWEIFKDEIQRRVPHTRPDTSDLRFLERAFVEDFINTEEDCPMIIKKIPFRIIEDPSFVKGVLEQDYCNLTREPRIYAPNNHYGVCLVYKNPKGQEYLKIPQTKKELEAAGNIRVLCHAGIFGACPGLKLDLVISEMNKDPVFEDFMSTLISNHRKRKAYQKGVLEEAEIETIKADPTASFFPNDPTGKIFYRNSPIYEEKVDSLRKEHYKKVKNRGIKGAFLTRYEFSELSKKIFSGKNYGFAKIKKKLQGAKIINFEGGEAIPPHLLSACLDQIPPEQDLLENEAEEWEEKILASEELVTILNLEEIGLIIRQNQDKPKKYLIQALLEKRTKLISILSSLDLIPLEVPEREELIKKIVVKLTPQVESFLDHEIEDAKLRAFFNEESELSEEDVIVSQIPPS